VYLESPYSPEEGHTGTPDISLYSTDNLLIRLILRCCPALFSINEKTFWIGDERMRILLYNPDNGVTRNFMPHPGCFSSGHRLRLVTKYC
jgi:hypothetical protein